MKVFGQSEFSSVEIGEYRGAAQINVTDSRSVKSAWVGITSAAAREIATELIRIADDLDKPRFDPFA